MPNFYAQYPIQGGGGGGVTSLNGLTGALTLVAGANITITPGAGTLTIAATGSGANTFLSNLTSPTAVNQNLLPDADITRDLGSGAFRWRDLYALNVRTGSITNGVNPVDIYSDVAVRVNGSLNTNPGVFQITEASINGANFIGFTVPAALASDTTYTLPLDGTVGQVLTTNGAGILSWTSPSGTGANTALSNLIATAVNQSLIAGVNNTLDLGSAAFGWRTLYTQSIQGSSASTLNITAGAGQDINLIVPAGRHVSIANGRDLFLESQATLYFLDATNTKFAQFKAPAAYTTSATYTLPLADGTAGQVLSTSGAGILSWVTASGGSGITSINGDSTAAQTLSVGTAGTDFAIVDAGGGSHVFNLPTASAVNRGALSSADWTTFNNKFTLPALTAGSVLFSDGTTIAQDNTNFNWDDTGKTLALGGVFGPPGTVPYAQTSQRTVTDPSGIDGAVFGIHYSNNTVNNGSLNTSGYFEGRIQIDAGVTTAANAGVIFQAYRNNGASDAGTLQFLVGAFGGAHQTGTDPAALTDLVAGVLSQVDITNGQANRVADFYGLAGTNGGTITTGQFGIYIEPPGSGVKDNWLSGKALIGGSTYASHVETLKVVGDMSATISVVDTGALAGNFNATSNTTTGTESNTTIGLAGVSTGLVQAGAVNDKAVYSLNFTTTRGDGTDDGNLSTMGGAILLQFHNSGAAGTTDNAFGAANIFFSQQGTVTNLYDFYSQNNTSGGTVTNHYGVYIVNDSASPVKNWLSGKSQFGSTSFVAPTSTIESYGPIGFMDSGFQVSFVAPTLAASTAYILPAADGTAGYVLTTDGAGNLSWMPAGAGSGANQSLSNLTNPTAINQNLIFDAGTAAIVQTKDDSGVNSQNLSILTGTTDLASGILTVSTGLTTGANNSGQLNLNSGTGAGSGSSGDILVGSGAADSGDSGNIKLQIGSSNTGNRGLIFLQDGTEGTAGSIWTSTNTSGAGHWVSSVSLRYFSSSTTISGALATVVYATQDYDAGSNYSSGVFTVPTGGAGKYQINAAILTAGTIALNNTVILEIQKNNTVISRTTQYAAAALTNVKATASDIINLADGDTIRIQVSSSATGPSIVSSNFDNYLSICRVGS